MARQTGTGRGRRLAALATKRALDVLVSICALVIAVPFFAVIAVAILAESPGTPIYVQRRVGRGGRTFPLVKFRTMVVEADVVLAAVLGHDPESAAQWVRTRKLPDDPRVTRVGRFLRRYSLDELPQLLNILRGDMSLVGPRPVLHEEIALFGDGADEVLGVRPGLTGLWAVSGRSEIDYVTRAELERTYVREWSLGADAWIILRTIPAVLRKRGAY